MILKKVYLLFILVVFISCGRVSVYTHKRFKEVKRSHRLVAILPPENRITRKLNKGENYETFKNKQATESLNIQGSLYNILLKNTERYSVQVQNIDSTNKLLLEAGIVNEQLVKYPKDELMKILGVDAVIFGRVKRIKTNSDGNALAAGALFGLSAGERLITNKAQVDFKLFDNQSEEALWRFTGRVNGGIGTSGESIALFLAKKLTKKFPYKKK